MHQNQLPSLAMLIVRINWQETSCHVCTGICGWVLRPRSVHDFSWGLEAYDKLQYNGRRRVWTTRWALCHPLSYSVSSFPIQLFILFKLLFETKQRSFFLSTCSSFLSGPHRKFHVLLGQNSISLSFFKIITIVYRVTTCTSPSEALSS